MNRSSKGIEERETQPFVYHDEGVETVEKGTGISPESIIETVSGSPLPQRDTFSDPVSYDFHHHESEKEDVNTLESQTPHKSPSMTMTLSDDNSKATNGAPDKGSTDRAYGLLTEFMADQDKIINKFHMTFQAQLVSLAHVRQRLCDEQEKNQKIVDQLDQGISEISDSVESFLVYTIDGTEPKMMY